jgi:hypothetical protein
VLIPLTLYIYNDVFYSVYFYVAYFHTKKIIASEFHDNCKKMMKVIKITCLDTPMLIQLHMVRYWHEKRGRRFKTISKKGKGFCIGIAKRNMIAFIILCHSIVTLNHYETSNMLWSISAKRNWKFLHMSFWVQGFYYVILLLIFLWRKLVMCL